jgi:protein gp37
VGVSQIEWTDRTWNPVVGCTKVSAGCKHCYAKTLHDQRHKAHNDGKAVPAQYAQPFETVQLMPDRLRDPLSWRKPQRVFVNSVSDLFHEDVPDEFLDRVFAVMALSPSHTFQVLTKRAERMRAYLGDMRPGSKRVIAIRQATAPFLSLAGYPTEAITFPLPNVWLGVSVEDQRAADERIPALLSTPAAVRFLSCEPLLGPVNLDNALLPSLGELRGLLRPEWKAAPKVDWVIVGGESGAGARPMELEWARSLVRQCQAAGLSVFVKQLGAAASDPVNGLAGASLDVPEEAAPLVSLRLKDKKGGDPDEWPSDLRVRQFPAVH